MTNCELLVETSGMDKFEESRMQAASRYVMESRICWSKCLTTDHGVVDHETLPDDADEVMAP